MGSDLIACSADSRVIFGLILSFRLTGRSVRSPGRAWASIQMLLWFQAPAIPQRFDLVTKDWSALILADLFTAGLDLKSLTASSILICAAVCARAAEVT